MRQQVARILACLLLANVLLFASACVSGPKVRTDFDKTVDFSQYKTFGFASPLGTDRSGYQTIVSQDLKAAARRELEARGLHYTESAPAVLVNFNGKLDDKLRIETVPSSSAGMSLSMGTGRGYYGYRTGIYTTWPMYDRETAVSSYTEGTLNVDIVDAARKQMVWEGVAVGTVTDKSRDNLRMTIDVAMKAIFKKYPLTPTT
jgi:hypothetical protein